MKKFDWTCFTKRIAVKSTIPEIYDAWAKSGEIVKWFLSDAEYYSPDNTRKLQPDESIVKGSTYKWNWYLFDITETGRILDANGRDFIQFTFAGECIVDISLMQKEDYIIVELTQKEIPVDDASKQGIRLGCDSGWSFFLVNLKSYYENGIDLRNKNPEFVGMINN